MNDPFKDNEYLDINFDTSYEESELWQGALRNEEDASGLVAERPAASTRIKFLAGAIGLITLLLAGRLLVLQIIDSSQNKALAEGNRIRETLIPAPRGVIYDANRTIVARNVPNFEVRVIPSDLPKKSEERAATYATLAEVLKKSPDEIARASEAKGLRSSTPILIAEKLDRDTSMLLQIRANNLRGVLIENNPQREYTRPEQYAHLLGYTGRVSEEDLKRDSSLSPSDFIGKLGIEQTYQNELKGSAGKQRVEVDASGQVLKQLQSTDPTAGKSLVLGIIPELQQTMFQAVADGIKSSKRAATGGSAIALNPKNGEILGMVSLPSFDNNLFVDGISESKYATLAGDPRKPLFNRPIAGEYPPGSTFKIVTATAALGEGVVQPGTYLASPPELDIEGYKFPDWDKNGHGSVNAAKALAVSSDVYFYKVSGGYTDVKGVGVNKLGDYMRTFGIGKPSGIDLPGEQKGLIPTPQYKKDTFGEDWFVGNTYQMGIGQGFVLTTPLEVLNYAAAIAGNGVAYKPHIVKAIENPDNPQDSKAIQPEEYIKLGVSQTVIDTVKDGMRQAVQGGTASALRSLPIDICGKTGSAEFANETNAHAWFTAFAPCNDPQIALVVMIEGGGEGSDVAVPAAKKILAQHFGVQIKDEPKK
jgi:penicillin-binding protein 2